MNDSKKYKYGVVNEDGMSLTLRAIEGDECDTLGEAFQEALEQLENGATEVAIVRCRYSAKHEVWLEVPRFGCIQVDATWVQGDWFEEDENDDAPAAPIAEPSDASEYRGGES